MLLEHLLHVIPTLEQAIRHQPLVSDRERCWMALRQLLQAFAPTIGATLPGGIIDQVTDIAAMFGLADRLENDLVGPGNPGLFIGVAKPQVDVIVVAPLDRLTLRINRLITENTAQVVPVGNCIAWDTIARSTASVLRFDGEQGRLVKTGQGRVERIGRQLRLEVGTGAIAEVGFVALDLPLRKQGDAVCGAGLENAAGVLAVLAAAAILRQVEEAFLEQNRRCLFVFPDRWDFDLNGLRDRLVGGSLQPLLGTVIVESQPVDLLQGVELGAGMAWAFSGLDRHGLQAPLNYQQLTQDFGLALRYRNQIETQAGAGMPDAGGASHGSYRQRVLGLMGPPLTRSDSGLETVDLRDIEATIWSLSYFLPLVLNLVPTVAANYALGR